MIHWSVRVQYMAIKTNYAVISLYYAVMKAITKLNLKSVLFCNKINYI